MTATRALSIPRASRARASKVDKTRIFADVRGSVSDLQLGERQADETG
jgi:hypothetical protein